MSLKMIIFAGNESRFHYYTPETKRQIITKLGCLGLKESLEN
jgi:hypothetical protein